MSIVTKVYALIKGEIMKTKIAKWYQQGIWTKEQVATAVAKKMITAEDYAEIVGEPYKV